MSVSPQNRQGRLKIGATLTFIGGLFPFTFGVIAYVLFFYSVTHPNKPWLAGQIGPAPYTLNDVKNDSLPLAHDFVMATHIEIANVINAGFAILIITVFGLRRRQKWAWYTLLAMFLWVGTNDVIAMVMGGMFPIPIIAEIVGLTGLWVARSSLFNGR